MIERGFDDAIRKLKSSVGKIEASEALRVLADLANPEADYLTQVRLARIYEKLSADGLDLKPLRLALLGSSTLDHLGKILPLFAALNGFALELFVGEFDTLHQTILNPDSDLYAFRPDVVWLFTSHRDVHLTPSPGAERDQVTAMAADAVERTAALWTALQRFSTATILQNNADLPEDQVFGNLEANVAWSPRSLFSLYNFELAAATKNGVIIFDLDQAAADYGRGRWSDPSMWHHSKHAFSLNASGRVAFQAMRALAAAHGKAKKCLVLDLDNTLWGGVIGDDGMGGIKLGQGSAEGEAFLAFQKYLAELKRRGVVLAVCSKNDEANAKAALLRHPEMALSLEDISVFVANWENKADNIREIAETLELGLDAFVFFDDNSVERALVRQMLPAVTVPEVPEDPALYVRCLDRLRLFEAVAYTQEDSNRAQMYRENAARKRVQRQSTDLGDFLRELEMKGGFGALDDVHFPRAAQLINKSNQFHLTTTRYSEPQLRKLMESGRWHGYWFRLADRFGDHGVISVVLLQDRGAGDWLIDTWCMSCRVLSRGMEEFILNQVVDEVRRVGAISLTGRYLPTEKNKLVAALYPRLGFAETIVEDARLEWRMVLDAGVSQRPTSIRIAENGLGLRGNDERPKDADQPRVE